MAVKNATFKPLFVATNRDATYMTRVETTNPIRNITIEEAENEVDIDSVCT